ncbi:MAG: hypothetical protein A3B86_01360 [Candidatus Yanofskybacteria bacterium RIFCSPHIGHO2_02_FULL_38_22b]|uniref:GtrA/DPMS transmembrane domain-containing protein n=1 Tax=Candidatus Yanofskybacteria bacterium RIFCSPHIGHO2_02_FULL_38_22b TaxID=1802673 RepID=A0A1F8F454_9BACT|nr:MAG: hypothetical protein A3B86_01360 [Candidatus Yanofskybacteria bacterium RIFCSPHIGHO2_02_FULL_38_22b]OGN20461.1 MAG: hypothetical protein A2910_02215 [Candidatus Yanofskybacteria bacterium RIFCSPLOWO2_01_FULL_39_28]
MFTKKDLFSSLITGFYTGLIAWQILMFLGRPSVMGYSFAWLMIVVPVFWILGVNLGYFLGRWINFFNQFGKFAAIGFTNAAVDFGVLNLLIAWSGIATGILYAVFKTISFIVSVTHSYYWNRHWVFGSQSVEKRKEFFEFISVYIVASAINVGTASATVFWVDPMFGLGQNAWANVGAVAGSAVALAFSFVGVRTMVFKKKENALPQI